MRILFDPNKSDLVKRKRGVSLEEAKEVIEKELGGGMICDDPEQYISLGIAPGEKLVSVIYEFREDSKGPYIWLVTLWNTTKTERKRYLGV